MEVSRVLMTMFTGSHTTATKIVASGCANTAIVPSSNWNCPHDNQIQWKDLANYEILQPGETETFLVRVDPFGLNSGEEEPGATVTATVYTDVGVFTKAGYTVGMTNDNQPLGSVYLTNSTSDVPVNSDMLGHLNDIMPGTNTTFYVAIADLDTNINTQINSGATLTINVPPGFANVTAYDTNTGFAFNATETVRADGVTQIVATTDQAIGDDADGEVRALRFWAITPSPPTDSTYLMFTFINGVTNSSPQFSAGSIAEIALQVNGTS
jgi:hypothetical protein